MEIVQSTEVELAPKDGMAAQHFVPHHAVGSQQYGYILLHEDSDQSRDTRCLCLDI